MRQWVKLLRGCALAYAVFVVILIIATLIFDGTGWRGVSEAFQISAVLTGAVALVTFGTWAGLASANMTVKAWQAIGGLALSLLGFGLVGSIVSGDLADVGLLVAIVLPAGLVIGFAIWTGAFGLVTSQRLTFDKPEA